MDERFCSVPRGVIDCRHFLTDMMRWSPTSPEGLYVFTTIFTIKATLTV